MVATTNTKGCAHGRDSTTRQCRHRAAGQAAEETKPLAHHAGPILRLLYRPGRGAGPVGALSYPPGYLGPELHPTRPHWHHPQPTAGCYRPLLGLRCGPLFAQEGDRLWNGPVGNLDPLLWVHPDLWAIAGCACHFGHRPGLPDAGHLFSHSRYLPTAAEGPGPGHPRGDRGAGHRDRYAGPCIPGHTRPLALGLFPARRVQHGFRSPGMVPCRRAGSWGCRAGASWQNH